MYLALFICLDTAVASISSIYVSLDSSTPLENRVHPVSAFSFDKVLTPSALVFAEYLEGVSTLGQSRLRASTVLNPGASDGDYFYALGLAEGWLSAERIVQQLYNVVWSKPRQDQYIYEFLAAQYNYMRVNADQKASVESYWFQVSLSLARLDGIMDGLEVRQREAQGTDWQSYPVTYMALYELNAVSELGEIAGSVGVTNVSTGRYTSDSKPVDDPEASLSDFRFPEYEMAEQTKCSALVKLTKNDLIVSHNTWTAYGEMLRIYKTIEFEHVRHVSFANKRFSMASYPGYLSSTDDWVSLGDTQLLVTETTNECIDKKRLREFVQPDSVTTVVRSLVASIMASTGEEWSDQFAAENSGTYNNQWIIVDFKAFAEWKSTDDSANILWIVEQAPGLVIGRDMSPELISASYWASYNRPYFSEIADVSGYTVASKHKGEWYHHRKCPRARMFAAIHSAVVDVESMRSVMTLNRYDVMNATYLHTHSCPKNQIAGRYDVEVPNMSENDFKKCGPVMAYGALDCKIASASLNQTVLMVSAPLWNNTVAAFQWDTLPAFAETAHWGHPNKWDFPFHQWTDDSLVPASPPLPNPDYIELPQYVIGHTPKASIPEQTLSIVP